MGNFEVGGVGHPGPEGIGGLDQLQLVVVPEHGEDGRCVLKKEQNFGKLGKNEFIIEFYCCQLDKVYPKKSCEWVRTTNLSDVWPSNSLHGATLAGFQTHLNLNLKHYT